MILIYAPKPNTNAKRHSSPNPHPNPNGISGIFIIAKQMLGLKFEAIDAEMIARIPNFKSPDYA